MGAKWIIEVAIRIFSREVMFHRAPISLEIEPMTTQSAADLDGLKARVKTTWMAGDYSRIATFTEIAANEFIGRRGLRPGMRVLDVACGSGNLALPAAKAGAYVTGVDIAPNLLVQARERAIKEGASIKFEEGDAEDRHIRQGHLTLSSQCLAPCSRPGPKLLRTNSVGFAAAAGRSR